MLNRNCKLFQAYLEISLSLGLVDDSSIIVTFKLLMVGEDGLLLKELVSIGSNPTFDAADVIVEAPTEVSAGRSPSSMVADEVLAKKIVTVQKFVNESNQKFQTD